MGVHLPLPDGLLSGWSTINADLLPLISRLCRHFELQCWSCWCWTRLCYRLIIIVIIIMLMAAISIQFMVVLEVMVMVIVIMVMMMMMMVMAVMLRSYLFGRLLTLSTLHLGLLQQSSLLGQPLLLAAILNLVLPDQRFRRPSKDALVFAEFTYPNVLQRKWVVQVRILLLNLALSCCQCVYTRRGPLLLSIGSGHVGSWGGLGPSRCVCLSVWTGLSSVGGKSSSGQRGGWSGRSSLLLLLLLAHWKCVWAMPP